MAASAERPEPRPGYGAGEVSVSLDRNVAEALPPVLAALTLVYATLVPAHLFVLEYAAASQLALGCAIGAGLMGAGLVALRVAPIPAGRGHPAATALALLVLALSVLHLYLGGVPRETTTIVLLVLGVGLFFLDWGWFSIVVGASLASWLAVAAPNLPDPDWLHFGITLAIATVLSGTVLKVRRANLTRMEQLRTQHRVRQIELESALDQTERARSEGEDARKAMETAIVQVKESEERFRRLAEATFEGVLFYRRGLILDANPRAAQLLRVSVSQMVGDPVLNLVAPEHRNRAEGFLLGSGRGRDPSGPDTLEVEGRRYDGTFLPAELSVVDSLYQGDPARVLVIRDVTNQKRAERMLRRALEEAEANSRAKSSFLANMSHELRTPLNSVIGFANILLKRQSESLPARELDYLRRIQTNGEHLLALIEDILDLSKIDAQRMEVVREPVPLDELTEEVVRMLDLQARRRSLELATEVPANLRPAIADHRRLRQVLLNLVGNALKFTQEGGVTIRVVSDGDAGRPLRIEVEDTGIGIPEAELEEVFSPFHQIDGSQARSFGGTGLGLAISRSLCELMGFELGARSRVGQGSTFFVDLDPTGSPGSDGRGGQSDRRPRPESGNGAIDAVLPG